MVEVVELREVVVSVAVVVMAVVVMRVLEGRSRVTVTVLASVTVVVLVTCALATDARAARMNVAARIAMDCTQRRDVEVSVRCAEAKRLFATPRAFMSLCGLACFRWGCLDAI